MSTVRVILGKEWASSLLTPRGLLLLAIQVVTMSVLAIVSLSLPDLSLMGQAGLLKLLFQVAVALAVALATLAASLTVAGERDQATLESLLLAPISGTRLLGAKWLAAAGAGAVHLLLSLPYLIVMGAGTGLALWRVPAGLGLALLLMAGYTGVAVAASTISGRTFSALVSTLVVAAVLEAPGFAAGALPKGALQKWLATISPGDQVMTLAGNLLAGKGLSGLGTSWLTVAIFLAAVYLAVRYAAAHLELMGGDAQ
ncbi:MAG: type transporter [Firmicutes bacterium]|nr:type transporter [Bacillota bacterium]